MWYRKVVLLLFSMTMSFFFCEAQEQCNYVLSGRIMDQHGKSLPGAAVMLLSSETGSLTDGKGAFKLEGLCAGSHQIRVQLLGFEEQTVSIEIPAKSSVDIVMDEVATELEEIVIQHHDEAHIEHAMHYHVLDEQHLSMVAGKTLGEALKQMPGVSTIQTGPGISKPVIHGVHSQRILILNHGLRHEGQQWGAEHAPEIDPFIAANVVVIKDASAIKYGTDALGGVVVVNPPPFSDRPDISGTVTSVFQSNGRSTVLSGMLEGGLKKSPGWGWRMQATGKRAGDYHAPDYGLTNTGVRELNFSASTGYHKKGKGFDAFFSRFQSKLGIFRAASVSSIEDLANAMSRTEPAFTRSFSYTIDAPRQEVVHNLFKLNGHIQTSGGEWRMQYGLQRNFRKEFDVRRGTLTEIPSIDLRLTTHTLDVEWETHHSERRTITFGLSGLHQQNTNIPGTRRIPFIPNFTSTSAGMFVVSKFFLDAWVLDAGLRYDFRFYTVEGYDFTNSYYDAALNFNNVSATFGVKRELGESSSLSLNASTAWRPPHVSELYSVGTHQSAAAIEYGLLLNDSTNEIMDIEDVSFANEQAVKVVGSYQFSTNDFSLSISPYVNYIANYIYLKPEGVTRDVRGVFPYFRYRQTDALFRGVDLVSSVSIGNHLVLSPHASLLRAYDRRNDDELPYIPSNRYKLAFEYKFGERRNFRNIFIRSNVEYVSEQRNSLPVVDVNAFVSEENGNVIVHTGRNFDFMSAPSGYALWNFATGFSIKASSVQYDIGFSIDNLLNTTYREYTNRLRYFADEPGRNFVVTLKCIF